MTTGPTSEWHGHARACANIALAKYWGKADSELNLPAVPSVSVTLDALVTETSVTFAPGAGADTLVLDGRDATLDETRRVTVVLDRIRSIAGCTRPARVESVNRFPTASGLASSASGFAALVAAANRALRLDLSDTKLSALARRGSASAARSVFGGFVELPAGLPGDDSLAAHAFAGSDWWDVAMVIATVTNVRKTISSRAGMNATTRTSPYYPAWLATAPRWAFEVREGVRARDLERVGRAVESSTFAFHACALAAEPSVRYATGSTLTLLAAVNELRASGTGAWATMDAGPHVKVLCAADDSEKVVAALVSTGVTTQVIVARPGSGVT